MSHKRVSCRSWLHHFGISLWHCGSYFFMCEALKLLSRSLAWQLNHIFYDAAGGYCAVPTFLRVFPVSAPCLSSSFKSIYCSQKSIRLSEERCRFWGYGSVLSHFLPLFLINTHTHTQKKNCDSRGACESVFWVATVRKKCHTSLEKSKGKLSLFAGQPNQWTQAFTSSARHTKSIFMLDQITSLPVTTPRPDKAFSPSSPHFLMLEILSVSLKAISLDNSIFFFPPLPLFSSPLLSSPSSPLQSSSLPSHCRLSPP